MFLQVILVQFQWCVRADLYPLLCIHQHIRFGQYEYTCGKWCSREDIEFIPLYRHLGEDFRQNMWLADSCFMPSSNVMFWGFEDVYLEDLELMWSDALPINDIRGTALPYHHIEWCHIRMWRVKKSAMVCHAFLSLVIRLNFTLPWTDGAYIHPQAECNTSP